MTRKFDKNKNNEILLLLFFQKEIHHDIQNYPQNILYNHNFSEYKIISFYFILTFEDIIM